MDLIELTASTDNRWRKEISTKKLNNGKEQHRKKNNEQRVGNDQRVQKKKNVSFKEMK